MENANAKPDSASTATEEEENPNNISNGDAAAAVNCARRTPFTDLSQVDADLALARTLQEQVSCFSLTVAHQFLLERYSVSQFRPCSCFPTIRVWILYMYVV